jgi:hypothetical protein
LEVTAIVIAVILAIGVVVAALDMKFQADQARWQQRQTCLAWYQTQAAYGYGPWYEALPAAAKDCGGGAAEDGTPLVPGGTQPVPKKPETASAAPSAAPSVARPSSPAPGSSP